MNSNPFAFSPFGLMAVAVRAGADTAALQNKIMVSALERVAHAAQNSVTWSDMKIPMIDMRAAFDEDALRDRFHGLADANLRTWEYAADTLKALPAWMNYPSKVPGTVMTDMFDQMRRAGVRLMPANDTWATAAENFSPPAFWARAPKGPALLDAPNGEPDDLTLIKGIGAKLSAVLNDLGVYHFSQIAEWDETDGEWIDDKLAFKGRVGRENWIGQAKSLAEKAAA